MRSMFLCALMTMPFVFQSFAFFLSFPIDLRHLSQINPSTQAFLRKEDLKARKDGQEVLKVTRFLVRVSERHHM